ncbi:hypothetical protein WJX81_003154 [Elliptochloris bilobata]|uniref:Uncharacterized protein n=1 Tax=Elliptochloris bilobata TaxID=381761 RepID=A0AAW1RE14_9CHLO
MLIKYAGGPMNTAFISGNTGSSGLTDAFYFAPYTELLDTRLGERGWTLVHTQLSSSAAYWGAGSLDEDAEELNLLARYLRQHHSSSGVIVMGHSTGCQSAVRYVQRYASDSSAARLLGIVLQAPVSDREHLVTRDAAHTAEQLAEAIEMMERGEGEEILYRDSGTMRTPVTARRFHALAARLGDDDMFSSDLTPEELKDILGPLAAVPTLFLLSEKDASVPDHINLPALAQKFEAAAGPSAKAFIVPDAGHGLHGHERECVDAVMALLDRLPRLLEGAS